MTPDAWHKLRSHTAARIALGRAGGSLPTAEVLDFAMAHAAARDAVHDKLDVHALKKALLNWTIVVDSRAGDRQTYLLRPDLGRHLTDAGRTKLHSTPRGCDLAIVLSDGLSARAVAAHAPPLVNALLPTIRRDGISIGPLIVVRHGRVAIQDEIGELLECKASLILLGERPGLGSPDSLGAYLVFNPKPGNTDAQRNCVSNIRPEGFPIPAAAELIRYLLMESLRRKLSGVALKDDRPLLVGSELARLPLPILSDASRLSP